MRGCETNDFLKVSYFLHKAMKIIQKWCGNNGKENFKFLDDEYKFSQNEDIMVLK